MVGKLTNTISVNGKSVNYTATVWGKAWATKEKRVDGNPTMIEEFADSGINVTDFSIDEVFVDDELTEDFTQYKEAIEDDIWYHEDGSDVEWDYPEEREYERD